MTTTQDSVSWYEVDDDTKQLLLAAAAAWGEGTTAETYINQALQRSNNDLNVLVAAYRFFFYRNNNSMALEMAQRVCDRVRIQEALPTDWEQLRPILQARREDPPVRLYLNAYAASGLVLARLGQPERAMEIATQVKGIDDRNEFGASVVLDILTQPPDEDDA